MLTKAVKTPNKSTKSSKYTFHLFKAPSSTNTNLNDSHICHNECLILKFAIKKADATIPTPRENSTRLVTSTITIANIGGISDQTVFTIKISHPYIKNI